MDDLDDNSCQRIILLYRHPFIIAGANLLKNKGAHVNNKKEDLKISLTGKFESCRNRIKEREDELAALLKVSRENFSILRLIPPNNPTLPPLLLKMLMMKQWL